MSLFDFLKGTKKIKDIIEYFGIEDWWFPDLTDSVRRSGVLRT